MVAVVANLTVESLYVALPSHTWAILVSVALAVIPACFLLWGPHRLSRGWFLGLSLLPAMVLTSFWLSFLTARVTWLTLVQALLVAAVLATLARGVCRRGRRACHAVSGAGVLAGVGAVAVVSYGGLRGEADCTAPGPVGCLVSSGPRVWVPKVLDALDAQVFADLSGADLGSVRLAGRNLRYVDAEGSNLTAADLRRAFLRKSSFEGATLSDAVLAGAWGQGARFREADLRQADLRRMNAYRVDFRGADLRRADLGDASFSHGRFDAANLKGAILRGTYLRFATGLTQRQLDEACGDARTRLPPGLAVPMCSKNSNGLGRGRRLWQRPVGSVPMEIAGGLDEEPRPTLRFKIGFSDILAHDTEAQKL